MPTMKTSVAEIADLVGGKVIGDKTISITGLSGIRQASRGDLTFVSNDRYRPYVKETKASAVLAPLDIKEAPAPVSLIQVTNPYDAFLRVLQRFQPSPLRHPTGIHPTAVLDESVELGANVAIDSHVRVASGCVIGANTVLYSGAYVGRGSVIGPDVVVHPNATIREEVRIGARCIIHSGAIIGADGFGFTSDQEGHTKIPQVGGVVLGDDVEIGANSAVDRATFGQTVIGNGTKIDNLVQIGHNVQIGEHCVISGNAGIAGSTILGRFVTVAAGAGIAGHIEIGDGVTVGGFAGVTKSVPAGKTVSGFPAVDHLVERRQKAGIRQVPDALKRIRELEQRIHELEERINGTSENNH